MVDTNVTRKFIGNSCLHRQLELAQPSFLQRNLRHILDAHEQALKRQRQAKDDPLPGAMVANERRAAGWDYPTREMLDDLVRHGDKPVLRLDALHLRHPKANPRKRKLDARDGAYEHADWLPSPEVKATWPCQVSIAVRETQNSKQGIHIESRQATISQHQQEGDLYSRFDIELAEPFLIEISKLFVAVETGTNGFRHWRRTVTAKYHLQVSVQCRDSDDTAELLSELENQSRDKFESTPSVEGVLRGVWDELPRCPSSDELLAIKRTRGHQVISSEYGMELSMGWTKNRGSVLQRHNRALHQETGKNPQLPTPSSSDLVQKETRYEITYKFSDGLSTKIRKGDGLRCPLCKERPKNLSLLLLHCSTLHDYFKFDVEDEDGGPASDSSVINKTILLSVAPPSYDKVTEQNAKEPCNWIAPQRPFDIEAHLRGEDDWAGPSKTKGGKKRRKQPGVQFKDNQPAPAPRKVVKRPAPEEVHDLPPRIHKKHKVPDVPGVRFYHSLSKKAIAPGEMVSDSDESVDEFWMMDIQRKALRELSINGEAQDFTVAFNQHLAREQSTSSVLMKEAVVRFTRLHQRELQSVGWQRPFRRRLEQLLGVGLVNRATVTHCIQLMHEAAKGKEKDAVMMNGMTGKDARQPGEKGNEPWNGVLANGVVPKDQIDREATRTLSAEPNGRATPAKDGERKAKERVRWASGGSISRDVAFTKGVRTPNGTASPVQPNSVPTSKAHGKYKDSMTNGATSEKRKVNGSHRRSETPTSNGRVPAEVDHAKKGLCVCGKSAKDSWAAVVCSNPECARRDFHLACVGRVRVFGWKCRECAGSGT